MTVVDITTAIINDHATVRAYPGARKTNVREVTTASDGTRTIHLDVAAPPEDGKANKEIERFLGRKAGRPCAIVRGKTGKDKLVKFS
jgi:uncharacterized protein (TIGR00251 family)